MATSNPLAAVFPRVLAAGIAAGAPGAQLDMTPASFVSATADITKTSIPFGAFVVSVGGDSAIGQVATPALLATQVLLGVASRDVGAHLFGADGVARYDAFNPGTNARIQQEGTVWVRVAGGAQSGIVKGNAVGLSADGYATAVTGAPNTVQGATFITAALPTGTFDEAAPTVPVFVVGVRLEGVALKPAAA